MHSLVTRTRRLWFIATLTAGLAAAVALPHLYPDQHQLLEIPVVALVFGEAGLAMLSTLLFYEQANSRQIIKLSGTVLSFSLLIGSIGSLASRYLGPQSQLLSGSCIIMSWVQMAIMNITGLLSTLTLFRLQSPEPRRPAVVLEKAPPVSPTPAPAPKTDELEDFSPPSPDYQDITEKSNALPEQEILEQPDTSQINHQERPLHADSVSLQTGLQEKTSTEQSAQDTQPESLLSPEPTITPALNTIAPTEPVPTIATTNETSSQADSQPAEPHQTPSSLNSESNDVGSQIDHIFAQMVPAEAQREFSGAAARQAQDLIAQLEVKQSPSSVGISVPDNKPEKPAVSPVTASVTTPPAQNLIDQLEVKQNPSPVVVSVPDNKPEKPAVSPVTASVTIPPAQDLIDQLEVKQSPSPVGISASDNKLEKPAVSPITASVAEPKKTPAATTQLSDSTKQLKEFGRLSVASGQCTPSDATGAMKSIGKMLVDAQVVGNIINAGDGARRLTTARIISATRGQGIDSLLSQVDRCPGVSGSLIVGEDGLVVASTLDNAESKDLLGAMSSCIHNNTNLATRKLGLGNLQKIILQSQDNMLILSPMDVGILAIFAKPSAAKLTETLAAIADTLVH